MGDKQVEIPFRVKLSVLKQRVRRQAEQTGSRLKDVWIRITDWHHDKGKVWTFEKRSGARQIKQAQALFIRLSDELSCRSPNSKEAHHYCSKAIISIGELIDCLERAEVEDSGRLTFSEEFRLEFKKANEALSKFGDGLKVVHEDDEDQQTDGTPFSYTPPERDRRLRHGPRAG